MAPSCFSAEILLKGDDMVTIEEGGPAGTVPLVYYDENGNRYIVGEAEVQLIKGELIALGKYNHIPEATGIGEIGIESFSVSIGPFKESLAEEASARLGPLRLDNRAHITDTNPNGEVRQCDRRDLHEPHEYQAEFGAYFNVYCPGNVGSQR
jgi:hypothetical protein